MNTALDPLEILFVREVMRTNLVALPGHQTLDAMRETIHLNSHPHGQSLYPVVDAHQSLLGVVTRKQLCALLDQDRDHTPPPRLAEVACVDPVVAFSDEPLRVVVHRMAETGLSRLPVLDPGNGRKLVGMISINDLLRARTQNLAEERSRERVLRIRLPFVR